MAGVNEIDIIADIVFELLSVVPTEEALMGQRRSRKARREKQEQKKKRRWLILAGAVGVLILIIAVFTIFSGQRPSTETTRGELSTAPKVGALAPEFELISNNGERSN